MLIQSPEARTAAAAARWAAASFFVDPTGRPGRRRSGSLGLSGLGEYLPAASAAAASSMSTYTVAPSLRRWRMPRVNMLLMVLSHRPVAFAKVATVTYFVPMPIAARTCSTSVVSLSDIATSGTCSHFADIKARVGEALPHNTLIYLGNLSWLLISTLSSAITLLTNGCPPITVPPPKQTSNINAIHGTRRKPKATEITITQ